MNSAPYSDGHLLGYLLHFGRLLRKLGVAVSTRQVYELAQGLTYVDLTRREDLYHTARSFLVHSADDLDIFDRAFDLFWCRQIEFVMEFGLAGRRRVREGSTEDLPGSDQTVLSERAGPEITISEKEDQPDSLSEVRASPTYSPLEILLRKDFADFTEEEPGVAVGPAPYPPGGPSQQAGQQSRPATFGPQQYEIQRGSPQANVAPPQIQTAPVGCHL